MINLTLAEIQNALTMRSLLAACETENTASIHDTYRSVEHVLSFTRKVALCVAEHRKQPFTVAEIIDAKAKRVKVSGIELTVIWCCVYVHLGISLNGAWRDIQKHKQDIGTSPVVFEYIFRGIHLILAGHLSNTASGPIYEYISNEMAIQPWASQSLYAKMITDAGAKKAYPRVGLLSNAKSDEPDSIFLGEYDKYLHWSKTNG